MSKIWLITGISSGIGKSLAGEVMKRGDFVVGTFRRREQVEAFNTLNNGRGFSFLLDVRNFEEADEVVTAIAATYGHIDVLVNNAGTGFVGAVEEATIDEAKEVFELNVFGAMKITQAVLPYMRARRSGHIIQISSQSGLKASAGFGIYNASKFALEGFSEALAQEVEPLGIRVTLVEPGPFRTGFAAGALLEARKVIEDYRDTAEAFRSRLRGVNGNQEGDPEKAAVAIFNLAQEANPPLRLPLGKSAIAVIQSKLDSVKADLEQGRTIAEQVVFYP